MALQRLPWVNTKWLAHPPPIGLTPAFTSVLLDSAADRLTFIGRFQHKDTGAKTVDGVGFLLGTVAKTNLSTLKVSLQDVSTTTGPVLQEDGTPDQTLSIANADAGFVTDAWYEGAFGAAATRSLTHGDFIAIVIQFDSFVAGDSVNVRGLGLISSVMVELQGATVANLSGTYAVQAVLPNVALRCSDGTYGTIENGFVLSALTTHTFNVATGTADEYAIGVQFPAPVELNSLWTLIAAGTAADTTEVLLYSGTTPLATVTVDHNTITSAAGRFLGMAFAPQALAANTLYRVAVRPLGTGNISLFSFDVAFANHFQCHPGGTASHLWTRLDQGAWGGEVTTRRLFAGVRPSAFDDGVSVGGGGGAVSDFLAVGVR